jgi:hypothetical protein
MIEARKIEIDPHGTKIKTGNKGQLALAERRD